jgi:C4-dicarboxylate-specific signal transduction histidine kinase
MARDGQRLGVLVERSADLVGVATLDGETRYVNPAGLRYVGLASLAAARTARVLDFVHETDRDRVRDVVWPSVIRAGRWQGEVAFRHFATGAALPFLVDAFRIDDPQTGQPMNVATVSRDLSPVRESQMTLRRLNETLEERVAARTAELAVMNNKLLSEIAERERADRRLKELQNELFHAARLSAAGQMAGALAHELNQPLTASTNYVNAARRLLATPMFDKAKVTANMTEGARQMVRAGQIIRRLRDFASDGESRWRVELVATLVDDASALALAGGEVDVILIRQFDPEAEAVFADRIQIQQVLVNLMRNALEAMAAVREPTLLVVTRRVDAEAIEIAVADNGPGLPAAVRARLFEPFVSSKRNGMGLGLSICRSIVEAHHGRISARANDRGGTTFRFTLTAARLDDADA